MDWLVRCLAVWRLSIMLVNEGGPFSVFSKLRKKTGIQYTWNNDNKIWEAVSWPLWNPLHCIYCTSMWVAIVLCILPKWVSVPIALSGVTVLIEDVSDKWL